MQKTTEDTELTENKQSFKNLTVKGLSNKNSVALCVPCG